MQTQRLLEITFYLLNRKSATADELAKRFGVSRRTIYRDIDILSISGIPVFTSKGTGGGIKIMDEFIFNKALISEEEQKEILSSVYSLSALGPDDGGRTLSKLEELFKKRAPDWIEVDLSHWSADGSNSFANIKTAIFESRIIEFEYYNTGGEKSWRRVEPVKLIFKGHSWYLSAFCLVKNDYRFFKLTRTRNLRLTDEFFTRRNDLSGITQIPAENILPENKFPEIVVILKIAPEMAYRVYDEFDDRQIQKNEDGSFTVTFDGWWEDERLYNRIFSFGEYAAVLQPEHVVQAMKEKIRKISSLYF
ncbi:MAG: YafY family transcriptional regulator [Clostridiales bacterium]|jgi:predicted DNA-binding transcriptional regulator YafY|nr:YafY family transcriptional regulator [Clostridiales bacterium]